MGVSVIVLVCFVLGVALVVVTWLRTAESPNRLSLRAGAAVGALVLNLWWIALAVLAAFRST